MSVVTAVLNKLKTVPKKTAILEKRIAKLQREGVISPKVQVMRNLGDELSAKANMADQTITVPTKERQTDISDYMKARMGEGDIALGTALHENDHITRNFWDDRPTMRAWRAANVMKESPAFATLKDDALRAASRITPEQGELGIAATRLDAEDFLNNRIIKHDYEPDEILGDSAARFLGHQRKLQRTGQLPIGDRSWMQELAVSSTAGDRFNSTIEAMRLFAQQAKKRYPNMTEGKVPVQGKLF